MRPVSCSVVGIESRDDKWRKYENIYNACVEAHVPVPREVTEFFGNMPPGEQGRLVELTHHQSVTRYEKDNKTGFDVRLDLLSHKIGHIRFFNTW